MTKATFFSARCLKGPSQLHALQGCRAGVASTQHYPLHSPRPLPHQPHLSCAVKLMGTRDKAADIDFSDFLEEEAESQLKEAGECAGQPCWVGA